MDYQHCIVPFLYCYTFLIVILSVFWAIPLAQVGKSRGEFYQSSRRICRFHDEMSLGGFWFESHLADFHNKFTYPRQLISHANYGPLRTSISKAESKLEASLLHKYIYMDLPCSNSMHAFRYTLRGGIYIGWFKEIFCLVFKSVLRQQ